MMIVRIVLLFLAISGLVYAQDTEGTKWRDYLVDSFEAAGEWEGEMPRDMGIIRVMRRDGAAPEGKDSPGHKYVLGTKVSYFKRGPSWFSMSPPREISIGGITKKLKVWVAGRNFRHELKALIRDFMGNLHLVSFGSLNFPGWQQMESHLTHQVIQDDHRYIGREKQRGINLKSMVVECAQEEAYGHYYIYLDDLKAYTDFYLEDNRDPDDIIDDW